MSDTGLKSSLTAGESQIPSSVSGAGTPTINHLPDELLVNIVSRCWGSWPNLSLTSKRFHFLSEPFLWESYTSTTQGPRRFLQSLLRRPHLSPYVTSISLEPFHTYNEEDDIGRIGDDRVQPESLTEEDRALYLQLVRELVDMGMPEEDTWLRLCNKGYQEAEVALLLCISPRLQALWMIQECNAKLVPLLFESAARGLLNSSFHGFRDLEYVTIVHWDTEGGYSLAEMWPFFCLPSVKHFSGRCALEEYSFDEITVSRWPTGTSPIETLEFEYSEVSVYAIETMCRACKALKLFSCEWGGTMVGSAYLTHPEIVKALDTSKDSLENLTLYTSEAGIAMIEPEELSEPIGSLARFGKLTELNVCGSVLMGYSEDDENSNNDNGDSDHRHPILHQILPKSLNRLRINSAQNPDIVKCLKELSAVCSTELPNLETISVDTSTGQASLQELRERFKEVGVQFIFSST